MIRALIALLTPVPQDPKRFSGAVKYAPNFHGELAGIKKSQNVNDRVKIDADGHVEFFDNDPFSGIDIPGNLTNQDVNGLRGKNLDPSNPKYAKAKAYFAQKPMCDKGDLAAASGIGEGTAKDVIAVFRKNAGINIPSPTDYTTPKSGGNAGEGEDEQ